MDPRFGQSADPGVGTTPQLNPGEGADEAIAKPTAAAQHGAGTPSASASSQPAAKDQVSLDTLASLDAGSVQTTGQQPGSERRTGVASPAPLLGGLERMQVVGATRAPQPVAAPAAPHSDTTPSAPVSTPDSAVQTAGAPHAQVTGSLSGRTAGSELAAQAVNPALTPASDNGPAADTSQPISPTIHTSPAGSTATPGAAVTPSLVAGQLPAPKADGAAGSTIRHLSADGLPIVSPGTETAAADSGGSGAGDSEEQSDTRRSARNTPAPAPAPQHAVVSAPAADSVASAASPAAAASDAASRRAVDRQQIIQQIARHAGSLRLSDGRGEMTIHLTPEHLGHLTLSVTSDAHGVAARIIVQTSQAHQAVESARETLRTALEQRGLTVNSLDVSLGGGAGGGAFDRSQERPAPVRTQAWTPEGGSAENDVPAPTAALDTPSSATRTRLDYRA